MSDWIDDVLRFWFEDVKAGAWFRKDERVDAMIRERFVEVYRRVQQMRPEELQTPRASVAAVIVLDQLPRNMFRASPQAYATDALALSIAERAITAGFERELGKDQRLFLYMPFQHSEDAAVQARSMELFRALADANALDYARQHRDVIERFGRFPHRNAVLGRTSSAAELEFLATHRSF